MAGSADPVGEEDHSPMEGEVRMGFADKILFQIALITPSMCATGLVDLLAVSPFDGVRDVVRLHSDGYGRTNWYMGTT